MGKVVMVIGVTVAVVFALVSILNIGLYGGAMDLETDNCKGPCRERTGALGIVAGVLGFLLSLVVIGALVLPLVVPALAEPTPSLVLKLLLLVCLFVVIAFYIVAWALMAKDIHDFKDALDGICDNSPNVWNAALAFGLFGFIIGVVLFVIIGIATVVDRGEGGGSGGGGGNPAKSEYD
jgi:hypothetical protein